MFPLPCLLGQAILHEYLILHSQLALQTTLYLASHKLGLSCFSNNIFPHNKVFEPLHLHVTHIFYDVIGRYIGLWHWFWQSHAADWLT